MIKLPIGAQTDSRIAIQQGALLIPDVIPGSRQLEMHNIWGYSVKNVADTENNLVQDLSDSSICDTFIIDCSDLKNSDFDVLYGLPSPKEIYSENQNDISHILTYNIFERAYQQAIEAGIIFHESTPVMLGYGISYLDALKQLKEWNRQRSEDQYFYIFE